MYASWGNQAFQIWYGHFKDLRHTIYNSMTVWWYSPLLIRRRCCRDSSLKRGSVWAGHLKTLIDIVNWLPPRNVDKSSVALFNSGHKKVLEDCKVPSKEFIVIKQSNGQTQDFIVDLQGFCVWYCIDTSIKNKQIIVRLYSSIIHILPVQGSSKLLQSLSVVPFEWLMQVLVANCQMDTDKIKIYGARVKVQMFWMAWLS